MADVAEQQTPAGETPAQFDKAAFIAGRNEGKRPTPALPAAVENPKPVTAASPAEDADDDYEDLATDKPHAGGRPPRSTRRLEKQLAYERGRREMLEQFVAQGYSQKQAAEQVQAVKPGVDLNAKPERAKYNSDAEYWDALTAYTETRAKSSAVAAVNESKEADRYQELLNRTVAKHEADATEFEDWEETVEVAKGLMVPTLEKAQMIKGFMGKSMERARVEYWMGKHPEEAKAIFAMDDGEMLERLIELAVEVKYLYPKKDSAAQAAPTTGKDRQTPEKPGQGGKTAAERDLGKPKPTSEIAARGGSAAPSEPDPKADPAGWIARRNALRKGQ